MRLNWDHLDLGYSLEIALITIQTTSIHQQNLQELVQQSVSEGSFIQFLLSYLYFQLQPDSTNQIVAWLKKQVWKDVG